MKQEILRTRLRVGTKKAKHLVPVVYFTLRAISEHDAMVKIVVVILEIAVFVVEHVEAGEWWQSQ